jgi:hypothetical protein
MSSEQDHLQQTDTEEHFGFKKEEQSAFEAEKGELDDETIRLISEDKDEPEWMLERRLRALQQFQSMPPCESQLLFLCGDNSSLEVLPNANASATVPIGSARGGPCSRPQRCD